MSTDLEKFVQKNREDFDDAAPSGKVWENIERSLPVKKEAKRFSLSDIYKWSAAAAIFFIALTSVYFLFIRKYSHEIPAVKTETPGDKMNAYDLSNLAPEFVAEFKSAALSIENRQKELSLAKTDHPELYQQFLQDLGVLDSSYRMLKNQAIQTPNRDLIIKAMIQNLQLQAELLGRQLMIYNEFKNTKTSKNEKNI
jgi:hypothetical protein